MKAGKFAVSVQYGGGFHYFVTYPESITEAMAERNGLQDRLEKERSARNNRGAAPKVIVWQRVHDD